MRIISTLVLLGLLVALGTAAPAPIAPKEDIESIDPLTVPRPGLPREFGPGKVVFEKAKVANDYDRRFVPKKPLSGDSPHINAVWTVPLGVPNVKPKQPRDVDDKLPLGPTGGAGKLRLKPPRDINGNDDPNKDDTYHQDCETQDDCVIGSTCSDGFCVDLTPVNHGGTGPIIPLPLADDDDVVPVHHGGVFGHVNGGLCQADFDCTDGLFCLRHKCSAARIVARAMPKPLLGMPNTLNHVSKEPGDCSPGQVCGPNHRCRMMDTVGHTCKEPGDCQPGSLCVNQNCTAPCIVARNSTTLPAPPNTLGHVCKEPGECGPGLFCGKNHRCTKTTMGRFCMMPGDCGPDMNCVKGKCMPPRGSEALLIDEEEGNGNDNANATAGQGCKEIGDCKPGLWCIKSLCMMPRESEALMDEEEENAPNANTNTLNHVCKDPGDCGPGLYCINNKCMMPRGSEVEAFVHDEIDNPNPNNAPGGLNVPLSGQNNTYMNLCHASSECGVGSWCTLNRCTLVAATLNPNP